MNSESPIEPTATNGLNLVERLELLRIQRAMGLTDQIGVRLSDRYTILSLIGRGGMGVVFSAHDTVLAREVAIKMIGQVRRYRQAGLRERFLREARALARLSHPNIVTVYDVEVNADNVFIVMELVDGGHASRWLQEKPRSRHEILKIFIDAGSGLAAAHLADVVHRDFKLSNLLVSAGGRARVVDFGLSWDPTVEGGDTFGGTPIYMSPQQHMRHPATPMDDQFAFCVSLWEALSGAHPFFSTSHDAEDARAACEVIRCGPRFGERKIPRRLRRILSRGMSFETSQRFENMNELLDLLQPRQHVGVWVVLFMILVSAGAFGMGLIMNSGDARLPLMESNDATAFLMGVVVGMMMGVVVGMMMGVAMLLSRFSRAR